MTDKNKAKTKVKKSKNHNKKNTSLRLDKQTLKALKIRAIEQETSIQQLIESLILDYLEQNTETAPSYASAEIST